MSTKVNVMKQVDCSGLDLNLLARKMDVVRLGEIDLSDGESSFNRIIAQKRVKSIAKCFDVMSFRPPTLYRLKRSKNGKVFGVIDGQHGLSGLALFADPSTKLNATIIDKNTDEALAERFKTCNANNKSTNKTDDFWADIFAKKVDAIAVKTIIESYDIPVCRRKPKGVAAIVNPGIMRKYYNSFGEEAFNMVFSVIRDSFWDKRFVQYKAIEHCFIVSLLQVVSKHPDIPPDIFSEISANEITSMADKVKVRGHKSKKITVILERIYRRFIKEYV